MRILSTKKLLENQRELLLGSGISFIEYDAISIVPKAFELPQVLDAVIITSQNGAKAFLGHKNIKDINFENLFIVGDKSKELLEQNGFLKVTKTAINAKELGDFIVKNYKKSVFTFFCANKRRDEIPKMLTQNKVVFMEVEVYETLLNEKRFEQIFDIVLFFSPSGVSAFAKANTCQRAVCIGETTAKEARKYIDEVVVANSTTVESVIAKSVKILKELSV